jgi:hypothetical protein
MLKDIRDLGKNFKQFFTEINKWNELTFNSEDKIELSKLENVIEIDSHSITLKIDDNHCVIPSQYILYSVFIKELAIGLREHTDVFEKFKTGKSRNQIGEEISDNTFNLQDQNLDEWSNKLALKPIIDPEFNFEAKSIINGTAGNYKVRGTSDFFTSVILKIINVPDASSSILGKVIYSLAGKKELYDYLEKRFLNELPFVRKAKKTNKFVYEVLSYLYQYDKLENISAYITANDDNSFRSLKFDDISLTTIFKADTQLLSDGDLSQGGKIRFFNKPIFINQNNEFIYLSTEWTSGTGSRLDLDNFKKIIANFYPEFEIISDEKENVFKAKGAPTFIKSIPQNDFDIEKLVGDIANSSLLFKKMILSRFTSSLLTKPFVILSGLSGSGKTKLAQAFAQWICQDKNQYCIVPVGADWTNREPLLGYPNALKTDEYIKPDNGALDVIISANNHPEFPHFLILDEMNLSHVERYFADFLSVMESKGEISLFAEGTVNNGVPSKLTLPSNLFIIGTVNIDETTYMFSPKVLDRANAIEFRVTKDEIENFFENQQEVDMDKLKTQGASMAKSFLSLAEKREFEEQDLTQTHKTLISFFDQLKKTGAEFGYRSASEILRLINQLTVIDSDISTDEKLDIAIMQKLLPKLHGSRRKLCPVLIILGGFCVDKVKIANVEKDVFAKEEFDFETEDVLFPISLEKITRMYKGAIENGFASYAEA